MKSAFDNYFRIVNTCSCLYTLITYCMIILYFYKIIGSFFLHKCSTASNGLSTTGVIYPWDANYQDIKDVTIMWYSKNLHSFQCYIFPTQIHAYNADRHKETDVKRSLCSQIHIFYFQLMFSEGMRTFHHVWLTNWFKHGHQIKPMMVEEKHQHQMLHFWYLKYIVIIVKGTVHMAELKPFAIEEYVMYCMLYQGNCICAESLYRIKKEKKNKLQRRTQFPIPQSTLGDHASALQRPLSVLSAAKWDMPTWQWTNDGEKKKKDGEGLSLPLPPLQGLPFSLLSGQAAKQLLHLPLPLCIPDTWYVYKDK